MQCIIVLGCKSETIRFKVTRNDGMNPAETSAEFEKSWVAALSHELIDDPMQTALLEDECANYA